LFKNIIGAQRTMGFSKIIGSFSTGIG